MCDVNQLRRDTTVTVAGAHTRKLLIGPGVRTAADADAALYGERDSDLFGRAIAVVDTDGDARDDLVLGAPSWPAGRGDGAVYLVEGAALLP